MGHKAYGVFIAPGMGLRQNDVKGTAVDDQAEGQYWVINGLHFNNGCCFDYGNAEIDSDIASYQSEKLTERSARSLAEKRRAKIIRNLGEAEAAFTNKWNVSAPVGIHGSRVLRSSPREHRNEDF